MKKKPSRKFAKNKAELFLREKEAASRPNRSRSAFTSSKPLATLRKGVSNAVQVQVQVQPLQDSSSYDKDTEEAAPISTNAPNDARAKDKEAVAECDFSTAHLLPNMLVIGDPHTDKGGFLPPISLIAHRHTC